MCNRKRGEKNPSLKKLAQLLNSHEVDFSQIEEIFEEGGGATGIRDK